MQREAFERLTVSQKIRKLASLARESIKNTSKREAFLECISWIASSSHPRLQKACALFTTKKERLEQCSYEWYHLYHHLLALNHEEAREEDFLLPVSDREEALKRWEAAVLLADVRSPFNVGSIIRTAEAFGWSEVGLCGITPDVSHPRVAKTCMSTHEWMDVHRFSTIEEGIAKYREKGYAILALEVVSHAVSVWEGSFSSPLVVVVGNEEFGLPEETLALVDHVVTIPLYGKKLSLNVANAFAIVAAVFSQRWWTQEKGKTEIPTSLPPSLLPR
ncbi:MAG: hypothetical protein N2314_03225 [Brevinematales bacterium]|nr:hypothetical protein [Brevinematales bacterium]